MEKKTLKSIYYINYYYYGIIRVKRVVKWIFS